MICKIKPHRPNMTGNSCEMVAPASRCSGDFGVGEKRPVAPNLAELEILLNETVHLEVPHA